MKKLLRRILIGMGVVGFILAALTVLLFNKSTLGWQANSVPTGSMRPMMQPGSLVLAHQVPLSSLKVGDVITHTNPLTMRTTLTHRIVKEYKINGKIPAFITKGDANPSPDPAFVGGLVIGKMVWHVPYVGRLLMWAKTWTGITILVYIPALLIMIHETRLLAAYLRLRKPYHLEGSIHWRPGEDRPTVRPKWAVATGTAFVAMIAVAGGWQAASALVTPPSSKVLLDLKTNTIQAQAAPAMAPNNSPTSCPTAGVNASTDQKSAQSGTTNSQSSTSTNANANCPTTGNTNTTNTQQQTTTDKTSNSGATPSTLNIGTKGK